MDLVGKAVEHSGNMGDITMAQKKNLQSGKKSRGDLESQATKRSHAIVSSDEIDRIPQLN